jgi:hypothetical protein
MWRHERETDQHEDGVMMRPSPEDYPTGNKAWNREVPRNPDECVAALAVAQLIGSKNWARVAEILRDQPAHDDDSMPDQVLDAARQLGVVVTETPSSNRRPWRNFRLPDPIGDPS